jgi:hypothetical protein
MIAQHSQAAFMPLSAVLAGVKEISAQLMKLSFCSVKDSVQFCLLTKFTALIKPAGCVFAAC